MSADDSTLSACGYSTGITAGPDGFGIAVHVDDLDAESTRVLGRSLLELADQFTPASPDLSVFTVALDAINEKRGTSHTSESVAESLGIDPATMTKADTSRIAQHIGGVLMR